MVSSRCRMSSTTKHAESSYCWTGNIGLGNRRKKEEKQQRRPLPLPSKFWFSDSLLWDQRVTIVVFFLTLSEVLFPSLLHGTLFICIQQNLRILFFFFWKMWFWGIGVWFLTISGNGYSAEGEENGRVALSHSRQSVWSALFT